ncbi:hypothetical protein LUZ60_008160 [Juncus effusus]|nr:hypothetical protein LUZ60_008160 [Juncus effusus]
MASQVALPQIGRHFLLVLFQDHTFHLPETSGKALLGPTNRYMLSLDTFHRSLSLFNPLTREEIPLPSPDGYLDWCSPVHIGKEKIVLVWGSNNSEDATLGFYKPGDSEWNTAKGQYLKYGHLYFNGKCYVNAKYRGCTGIIDEVTGEEVGKVTPLETVTTRPTICKAWGGTNYLVEASGEILLIFRAHDEFSPLERCYFDIHRLESCGDEKPKWNRINGIDDHMIFLELMRGFAMRASQFSGYKGNCFYFLKYRVEEYEESYVVCRYDIEDGRAEELPYSVQPGGCWFMPSME